ncbi:MAG TPA: CDP-alcohol phosphatidyltransferase family protein [Pseudonocardiaceae bacterium]|nr:CDP-alcohol phosphatidyltransferase family protein [Pseudonocardiaceae bacterium]
MLNIFARDSVARVTDPIGTWLLRHRVSADVVTVVGTVGVSLGALVLFPLGYLFAGTLVVWAFVMFDMLDGAVARAAGGGTRVGAVLDSTCDRIADGALFAALTWWCFGVGDNRALAVAALLCLVTAQVISYVKARAEAAGLQAGGGLVERPERWIIALVGSGLHGLGIPFALDVALWVLAVLSVLTVAQRFVALYRSAREAGAA